MIESIRSIYKICQHAAIDFCWFAESEIINLASITVPYLRHELILNLGDTFTVNNSGGQQKIIFSEIQTQPIQTTVKGSYQALGIMFNPIGIYETYGLSMADYKAMQASSAQALLFDKGETLKQKIEASASSEEKLNLLTTFFLQHSVKKTCPPLVVAMLKAIAAATHSPIAIKKMADDLNFCSKHLIASFKKVVGITPKKYMQLVQLNHALESMKRYPEKKLTETALAYGFYDQSHFIRIFKRYAGMKPLAFKEKQAVQPHSFANTIIF